jgi:HlyD family secretion protein
VAAGDPVASVRTADGRQVSVPAPVGGLVDQLYVSTGTFVTTTEPVLEMLPGQRAAALMFVPVSQGKVIQPGMHANVSPSTAPAAQYGSIKGVVVFVSPLPLTVLRLSLLLGDRPNLLSAIQEAGPSLEVVVALDHDPATPSGYQWTSGIGPPFRITPGTLLTGTVTVSTQHPADVAFSNS